MFAALFLPMLVIAIIGIIRLGSLLLKSPPSRAALAAKEAARQKHLRLAGTIILIAGLLAAGAIYLHTPATEDDSGAIGYEIDGGTMSPMAAGDSKSYDQQMEGLGGAVSVLAADIRAWLHGRKLAYTLALLSVSGAVGCFIFAHLQVYAPPKEKA
jgi:hypothetical protein